jgi:hypothetical protein
MNAVAATEQTLMPAPSNTAMGFGNLQSFELMQRAAKLLASSTLVPKEYQGNISNCVIALNMAMRIGADPLMVMQNLYLVHGRPGWSSQFLIATFNQCDRFSAMRFEFFGEAGKDSWGCRAWSVERETGAKLVGADITIKVAKDEGWYAKNGSKWKTMPQQMLMYRAASWFVRAYAPELSMGLQTQEELRDVGELPTVSVTQASRAPQTLAEIEHELVGTTTGSEAASSTDDDRITAQDIHDALVNATTRGDLDEAADLIRMLPEEEQQPLLELWNTRCSEVTE